MGSLNNKLSELKALEDNYLQDSLIRLKEVAVKKKADAKKREDKFSLKDCLKRK